MAGHLASCDVRSSQDIGANSSHVQTDSRAAAEEGCTGSGFALPTSSAAEAACSNDTQQQLSPNGGHALPHQAEQQQHLTVKMQPEHSANQHLQQPQQQQTHQLSNHDSMQQLHSTTQRQQQHMQVDLTADDDAAPVMVAGVSAVASGGRDVVDLTGPTAGVKRKLSTTMGTGPVFRIAGASSPHAALALAASAQQPPVLTPQEQQQQVEHLQALMKQEEEAAKQVSQQHHLKFQELLLGLGSKLQKLNQQLLDGRTLPGQDNITHPLTSEQRAERWQKKQQYEGQLTVVENKFAAYKHHEALKQQERQQLQAQSMQQLLQQHQRQGQQQQGQGGRPRVTSGSATPLPQCGDYGHGIGGPGGDLGPRTFTFAGAVNGHNGGGMTATLGASGGWQAVKLPNADDGSRRSIPGSTVSAPNTSTAQTPTSPGMSKSSTTPAAHNPVIKAFLDATVASDMDAEMEPPSKSMTVTTLKHQKMALAWMVGRETGVAGPYGGILADDQGLGKTVTTISLILTQHHPVVRPDVPATGADDAGASTSATAAKHGVSTQQVSPCPSGAATDDDEYAGINADADAATNNASDAVSAQAALTTDLVADATAAPQNGSERSPHATLATLEQPPVDTAMLQQPQLSCQQQAQQQEQQQHFKQQSFQQQRAATSLMHPHHGPGVPEPMSPPIAVPRTGHTITTFAGGKSSVSVSSMHTPTSGGHSQLAPNLSLSHSPVHPHMLATAELAASGFAGGGFPASTNIRMSSQAHVQQSEPDTEPPNLIPGGTLVVCPTSVLGQWAREIKEKVNPMLGFTVHAYHGKDKIAKLSQLAAFNVVLTTYGTLATEAPLKDKQAVKRTKQGSVNAPINLMEDEEGEDDEPVKGAGMSFAAAMNGVKAEGGMKLEGTSNVVKVEGTGVSTAAKTTTSKVKNPSGGPLYQIKWTRVVLDEAQSIKNPRTLAAHSTWRLHAYARWCLSGTPIQNTIDDLFSYFKFLRYQPYCEPRRFKVIKDKINGPNPSQGYAMLQVVLKPIIMRRTKQSTIKGQPIINLPPRDQQHLQEQFTPTEAKFYSQVQADSARVLRESASAGGGQQYVNMLYSLLKLRQACNHPWLVKASMRLSKQAPPSVADVAAARKLPAERRAELIGVLAHLEAACPVCSDVPEDPCVSTCGHVFCRQCANVQVEAVGIDGEFPCGTCSRTLRSSDMFSGAALEAVEGSTAAASVADKSAAWVSSAKVDKLLKILDAVRTRNTEAMNSAAAKTHEAPSLLTAKSKTDSRMVGSFRKLPSIPRPGAGSGGGLARGGVRPEKVIVFSQWTGMLDLLEIPFKKQKYFYRRLDGTMTVPQRERAISDFESKPEVLILLVSLKAAALGLNLTCANHVVLMDLWWNPTTEEQAIDRAHRIGQTRVVHVVRLTIAGTVEDRILKLQEQKREVVAAALTEGQAGGAAASRLSMDELRFLFEGGESAGRR